LDGLLKKQVGLDTRENDGLLKKIGGGHAIFTQGNEVHGPALGWAMMNGIYAMIGNFATLGVNM